jgi:hypothetical protein
MFELVDKRIKCFIEEMNAKIDNTMSNIKYKTEQKDDLKKANNQMLINITNILSTKLQNGNNNLNNLNSNNNINKQKQVILK